MRGCIGALLLSGGALTLFPSAWRILSSGFLPDQFCDLNNTPLIRCAWHGRGYLARYFAISCSRAYLVWRTRCEMTFSWMLLAFGLSIVACGFTHLMEVIVTWKPLYWLSGEVKLVTSLASLVTAIALPGLIPRSTQW